VNRIHARRSALAGAPLALMLLVATAPAAGASPDAAPAPAAPATTPDLAWAGCGTAEAGTAAGVECATAALPMDYDDPDGEQVQIAVARVPATVPSERIGSLFFNFGGPGAASVDYLQAAGAGFLATLNERFDLIGLDPRGTGQSTPAIDCKADQETLGIYSTPVPTPLDIDVDAYVAKAQAYVDSCLANNGPILEHVSTANVARDMDAIRGALGDAQLDYLGFSYGTFLGATYASLFPDGYRSMVLDGPLDASGYVNDPLSGIAEQTAGFEVAFARFTEACAVDQVACGGFGGTDPYGAYDKLVAAAEATPIPAPGHTPDPRPVGGDEIRSATIGLLYSKPAWGLLGSALAEAAAGDASVIRAIVDESNGDVEDGSATSLDRYFTIGASEQQYPQGDLELYLDRGSESWASFPHFWSNSGYAEISYALWPARDEDAFLGPFSIDPSAPTPLVIATTYDPATPYPGALRLVQQLGNARLLTMDGDGHTAYGGNSACIDAATEAYLTAGTLPADGTVCTQEVPFTAPEAVSAGAAASLTAAGGLVGRVAGQR